MLTFPDKDSMATEGCGFISLYRNIPWLDCWHSSCRRLSPIKQQRTTGSYCWPSLFAVFWFWDSNCVGGGKFRNLKGYGNYLIRIGFLTAITVMVAYWAQNMILSCHFNLYIKYLIKLHKNVDRMTKLHTAIKITFYHSSYTYSKLKINVWSNLQISHQRSIIIISFFRIIVLN